MLGQPYYDDYDHEWLESHYLMDKYPKLFSETLNELYEQDAEVDFESDEKIIAILCKVRDEEIQRSKDDDDYQALIGESYYY